MELRQLEHFVAVAEEKSFTRAARRVHIVQSGLSMSIQALEQELGAQLFDRTARGVVLTQAGAAMLPEARRALASVITAREAVDATRGLMRGRLEIGVAQAMDVVRIAHLLGRFRHDYPGVTLRVFQGSGTSLFGGVQEGRFDLALSGKPLAVQDAITTRPLVRAPFRLACAPGHPLAARERVTLAELSTEPLIEMQREWVGRQHTDHAFEAANLPRNIACELDDALLLLAMVQEGLGCAIVPWIPAPLSAGLRFIEIEPALPEWQFVAAFLGEEPRNAAARVFLERVVQDWAAPD